MRPGKWRPSGLFCSGRRLSIALLSLALIHCGSGDPIERAREYQDDGLFQEAVDALQPLIDQASRDPQVLYLYGSNQRRAGRPGLAVWPLQEARRSKGWEIRAGLELAVAAHDAAAWSTAIDAASRVLEQEPDNLLAYAIRTQARIESRADDAGALADLDRAIELDPDNVALRLGRVGILLRLNRIDEAGEVMARIEELATPVDFSPRELAGFCVARATFERESGRAKQASAAFEECLKRYPGAPAVVIPIVEHYDRLGQQARGNQILADLVDAQPFEFIPRAELARRLHATGEREQAEALLLEGGELPHPFTAAHALSALADLYVEEKRFEDAARVFGRARQLSGDPSPQRILAHAELLALAGESQQALALAEELGDHVYSHLVYAAVSTQERDAQSALEHLEVALVQWPDNAAAQYYAGRAAERLGKFPRAVDAYRNSIRAGAGKTDAGIKLAQLHRAAGRFEEAHVAVNHHVKEHQDDVDAALLSLELATRLEAQRLQASLELLAEHPTAWARAAALLSKVAAERGGAAAGIRLLQQDERIDLEDLRDAAAIEALVGHLRTAGRDGEARAIAEELVSRNPAQAHAHWILSLARDGEAAREALERAARLDPTFEPAARARARLAAGSAEVDAAVASLESFVPQSPEVLLDIAKLLASAGRLTEAESRLETLLWERPHHADAARELVLLRLARSAGTEPRTLELAQRGVRFGGGAEAKEVLARVFEARGDQERAQATRNKTQEDS